MAKTAPYGSWASPLSAELIVSETVGLSAITVDGEDICWLEARPAEGGRQLVVHRSPEGKVGNLTPPPYNARTRVHEYGGRPFTVRNGILYFSNFTDQRLYVQRPSETPEPLTPEGPKRYADYLVDDHRGRLICVQEAHGAGEPENTLISLELTSGGVLTIVSGHDFYSSPRLSPDGSKLAWLAWNHPNMPWDATELWLGNLNKDGAVKDANRIAGGADESIFQPEWSPDNALYFVSDRTGWWNPYRWQGGKAEQLLKMEAEFGLPQWQFGMSTCGFASAERMICLYRQGGIAHLASLDLEARELKPIDTPYTEMGGLQVTPTHAYFAAASPSEAQALVRLELKTGETTVLKRSSELTLDPGYISIPEAIEFPSEDGLSAHGFFYPPRNNDFKGPEGERPPLLVLSHGGPTSATTSAFNLSIQYWTSRGIAVFDVNYGGSTGYGRGYRERLNGRWGIVDVDDCVNGARYLVRRGSVDGNRLMIRGGSAGGYTTLSALTFKDVFKAGASYYGVSDLEALAKETHKFESRYLERLVGPHPAWEELCRERSPLHFTEKLNCPILLLQGLDDEVVPPNQATRMFEAVRAKGLPAAYLAFEGESHGFRKAETIKRALEAELYFYGRVFGFSPADTIEPITIENL